MSGITPPYAPSSQHKAYLKAMSPYPNGRGAAPHTAPLASSPSPKNAMGDLNPLRVARYNADLTLTEVSEEVGISRGQLSRLENGKAISPRLDLARDLARVLDTTVDKIFPPGGDDS